MTNRNTIAASIKGFLNKMLKVEIHDIQVCVNGNDHTIRMEECFGRNYRKLMLDEELYLMHKVRETKGHAFYNISVEEKKVMLDIFTGEANIKKYSVYIDDCSINGKSSIQEDRAAAEDIVLRGFWHYSRLSWKKAFKEVLLFMIIIMMVINVQQGNFKVLGIVDCTKLIIIYTLMSLPICMVIFLLNDWIVDKKSLKERDKYIRVRKESYYF